MEPIPRIIFKVITHSFNVFAFEGAEEISKPYCFKITVLVDDKNFQASQYICEQAVLNINKRFVAGIITKSKQVLLEKTGKVKAIFTLSPKILLAKNSKNVRVILYKSVPEIVREILLAVGYTKAQIKFHLQENHEIKPYRLQVPDETNLEFLHRLLIQSKIIYWIDTEKQDDNYQEIIHLSDSKVIPAQAGIQMKLDFPDPRLRGDDKINPRDDGINYLSKMKICYSSKGCKVKAESNIFGLKLCCNVSHCSGHYKAIADDYIIQSIKHVFHQNIEQIGDDALYYNELILHPKEACFFFPILSLPKFPEIFNAHVESAGEYAQLDENGYYRLRQHFDISGVPNTVATPPIMRLSPHGWHTPLLAGAEVLVAAIDGDPDQPIIIGTVSNAEKISPVTVINKQQNCIVTQGGNKILMDDTKDQERIQLNTYAQHNLIELNADQNVPQINITTAQGRIKLNAKKILQIKSDNSIEETIGADYIQVSENNYKVQTKNQDIHFQSNTDMSFLAKKNLYLQAEKNIMVDSADNLNMEGKAKIKLIANEGIVNFSAQKGNIFIQSAQDINIVGNGKSNIEFIQKGSGFRITKDGVVEFFGNAINFLAQDKFLVKGKLNYISNVGETPQFEAVPNCLELQEIPDLNFVTQENKANAKKENYKFNDEFARNLDSYLATLSNISILPCSENNERLELEVKER